MSRKDYLREWRKLNKNVLTREEGENATLTESVFETTSETATVLHHGELTDQSDYLFDANDSIDKNYMILMMNWIILCYLKMKTLMKMKMQLRLNCVRSYAHGMENTMFQEKE